MSIRITKAMHKEIVEAIYKASDLPARKEALRKQCQMVCTQA